MRGFFFFFFCLFFLLPNRRLRQRARAAAAGATLFPRFSPRALVRRLQHPKAERGANVCGVRPAAAGARREFGGSAWRGTVRAKGEGLKHYMCGAEQVRAREGGRRNDTSQESEGEGKGEV